MSFLSSHSQIAPQYHWSNADFRVVAAIENVDQQYKDNGSILYVTKTIEMTVEVMTEFELKMKECDILEIIYSPDVGFHLPYA